MDPNRRKLVTIWAWRPSPRASWRPASPRRWSGWERGDTPCPRPAARARSVAREAQRNIGLEVISQESTPRAILEHLAATYHAQYAMIVFTQNVKAKRPEEF